MNKEYKPAQRGLLALINRYQDGVRRDGGIPHTSEFVKRCLTRYGLPGAFQSYVRINKRRADKQRILLESNFAGGKEKSDRVKNVENKLLSLLFEFVVTPVETVATMTGQGKQIQTFNQSLGAADWQPAGGYFEKGDGYVMTSSGLAFDPELWEKYHPGQKWVNDNDPRANY